MEQAIKITNPIEQVNKMPSLKESYGFVSSKELIGTLEAKGWVLSKTDAVKVRRGDRQGYQKHLMRFRHPDFQKIEGLSDTNTSIPEIVIVNSHDGTTALRMMLGLYRLVCSNGLMVGTSLQDFRVIHSGEIAARVGQGIDFLASNIHQLAEQVQRLQNSTFTPEKLAEFTKTVIDARLSYIPNVVSVNYKDALAINREADMAQDAFTLMNRVQENVMQGGIHYVREVKLLDDSGNVITVENKETTTRRLRSVPQQVKLNRLVYDEALKLVS